MFCCRFDNASARPASAVAASLVVFGGMIRDHNLGDHVVAIEYDVHRPTAERAIRAIEAEACERFAVRHCRICHRTGRVGLGEASVWIVVRSGHRPQAYDASRWAIDVLKQRVSIWKLEVLADGTERYLDGHPIRPEGESDA